MARTVNYSKRAEKIKEMIDENKTQETTCHFCGNKYYFTKEDLDDLYKIKLIDIDFENIDVVTLMQVQARISRLILEKSK